MNDELKAAIAERAKRERAKRKAQDKPVEKNPDGTYGEPPEGYFVNPVTGQLTSREMLTSGMDEGTTGGALWRGISQGATFGLYDEIGGLTADDLQVELYRARLDKDRADHPVASIGGEMAGGIATAAGTAPLAVGKSLLGTVGRGAGLGLVEGALYGAGTGEGLKGRAEDALKTGLIGGAFGGAFPILTTGAKSAFRALTNPVSGALNMGNAARAERALAANLKGSKKTIGEVTSELAAAAADGQGDYRLVDALGRSGQRRASGIVRAGGDAADELADFLADRQAAQGERVGSYVEDAFDLAGTTAAKAKDSVKKNRKAVADALFDQAAKDAKPVDVRGAVQMLDDTIGKMTNSGIKPPRVVKEFQKLRAQLAGKTPDGDPTTLSDYQSVLTIWREVREKIDDAYRSGKGDVGEALKPIRDALQASLEESSDLYRSATDLYRVGSGVVDAFDTGAQMASPTRGRAADNVAQFSGLAPQEQRAARIGYGDNLLAQLERNASPTANKAKPLTSPKRQAEIANIANDPDLLARRLDREGTMWSTQNRALGGSRTADNLADMDGAEGVVAGTGGVIRSALNLQLGDALSNAASLVAPRLTGQNEATRGLIASALMSADPGLLAKAVGRQVREETRLRVVDGILRNVARIGQEHAN